MTRFFTADLHFGHVNIIKYADRPFSGVDEMNAAMIDRWNSVVTPDDEVFILGDLAMGQIAESFLLVRQLSGHISLVPGNHDRCWGGHGMKAWGWAQRYFEAGIDRILNPHAMRLTPELIAYVDHFPYAGSDPADEDRRYGEYRPTDDGLWLLHGHVHEKWRTRGRMINVGVDRWDFTPVSTDQIVALIADQRAGQV